MNHPTGRHFLQIPGPTNTPLPVLAAIAKPTIDHRGPEFQELGLSVLAGIKRIFRTTGPVVIYPASGTGAWEAALANSLSPGDKVLMVETGWFATLWKRMAEKLQLRCEFVPGDWRSGVNAASLGEYLRGDGGHEIKAVAIVHNETSTGVCSNVQAVRRALDDAGHPALLLVDTISSLGSIDYRHDEWGVDVTVGGSQKGLMLPPGLSFNALSQRALQVHGKSRFPRSFWDWSEMLASNKNGYFPYTPASNMLQGLRVAIEMLETETLEAVFARHERAARATRRAVSHWGYEIQCSKEAEYSNSLTAVRLPAHHSADGLRQIVLEQCNISLGNGLGPLADRVFRIGHLGDFNNASVLGTLAGIELGLGLAGIPFRQGGVEAAVSVLIDSAPRIRGVAA